MAATNRFSVSPNDQYTQQYVPLPFEAISALGEKANKNFETGKKAEAELGALGAAIKAAPMYQEDRYKFINSYNDQLKALVEEAKGDYGSKDFQAKASALTNQFKNDPKLQAFKGTLDAYEEYTKRKGKEGAERDLDYTYERDPSGNFVQKDVIKDGKYGSKFTKYADYDEATKKVMGTIAKDAKSWEGAYDLTNTQTGNNGETLVYNRRTGGYEGVSSPKLQRLAQTVLPNYRNTDAGKHQLESILKNDFQLGDSAYNASYDQLSAAAYQGDEQAKKMKEYIDNKMLSTVIAGNAHQVGMETKQGLDSHFDKDRQRAAANDDDKVLESLTPSTVQGLTTDATHGDPQFAGLVDHGVFVKGSNGLITFNMDALTKTTSTPTGYTTSYMGPGMGVVTTTSKQATSAEKLKEFNDQLIKMSNAVGVNPKSLSKDGKLNNIEVTKLVNAYNSLTKSRVVDLNLAPAVQRTESKLANLNWDYIKEVDPKDPTKTIINQPLGEDEKVVVLNRRTDDSGKMYMEGNIVNSKGVTIRPIAYRSNLREKNLVYDGLGKVQKASIDNLSTTKPEYIKDDSGKDYIINVNNKPMKIFTEENVGQGRYIHGLVDPTNKNNVIYQLINEKTGQVEATRGSLGAIKKDVEKHYFKNTPEGYTELEAIKSDLKAAENQQASQ